MGDKKISQQSLGNVLRVQNGFLRTVQTLEEAAEQGRTLPCNEYGLR